MSPRRAKIPTVKTFDELFSELADKAETRPEGSGTVAALDKGVHTLGKKIIEESGLEVTNADSLLDGAKKILELTS